MAKDRSRWNKDEIPNLDEDEKGSQKSDYEDQDVKKIGRIDISSFQEEKLRFRNIGIKIRSPLVDSSDIDDGSKFLGKPQLRKNSKTSRNSKKTNRITSNSNTVDGFNPIIYRKERYSRLSLRLAIFFVLISAFGYFFRENIKEIDGLKDKGLYYYYHIKDLVPFLKDKKSTKLRIEYKKRSGEYLREVVSLTEALEKGETNCKALVKEASYRRKARKLLRSDEIAVAECYLFLDKPDKALSIIAGRNISMFKRTKIKPLEILYLSVFIRSKSRLWLSDYLIKQSRRFCPSWKENTSCIGRLLSLGSMPIPSKVGKGYTFLKNKRGSFKGVISALISLASARILAYEGRNREADKLLKEAYGRTTNIFPAIRKEILEARVENAYLGRNVLLAKKILQEAESEYQAFSSSSLEKIKFYVRVLGEGAKRELLSIMNSSKTTISSNPEVFNTISYEAIRWGLSDVYLQYLSKVRNALRRDKRLSTAIARLLDQWEIRGYFALKQYGRVYNKLNLYINTYGEDLFSYHFKGVSLSLSSEELKYQISAVRELRMAVKRSVNWQSLYALGVAQLKARMLGKVSNTLKSFDKATKNRRARGWGSLLKLEYKLRLGQHRVVLSNINRYVQKYPKSIKAWSIKLEALRALGMDKKVAETTKYMAKNDLRGDDWKYAKYSPIGPFALLFLNMKY